MEQIIARPDITVIFPQITLVVLLHAILVLDLLIGEEGETGSTAFATFLTAGVTGYFCLKLWNTNMTAFGGMVVMDNYSNFFNLIFLTGLALTVLLSGPYLKKEGINQSEYYLLLMGATFGMMLMASAGSLLTVFLGIEMLSICLYVLAGFARRKTASNEAALKYLLLGAFATGFLVYGIALIYGATGTMDLEGIREFLETRSMPGPMFLIGMVMILVGFAFKASLAPFHVWAPDVYQGAPTPVTGFMATGAKAAAFAVFFRVFFTSLSSVRPHWSGILWVIAVLTMTIGNVTAISQTNIKRMLAYSSIAHAGYILIAVVAGNELGSAAIMFYLLAYTFMNIGAFGVITVMARKGHINESLSGFSGIAGRFPLLAALMAVFMFSLAGIPATAGFMGKFYVFAAAVRAGQIPLVIIGLMNAVVSVYYYLRVVVVMYMNEPEVDIPDEPVGIFPSAALIACAAGVFFIGILPSAVIATVQNSILLSF